MTTIEAALAAFNPEGWPVHVITRGKAMPAPDIPAFVVAHDANDPALDGAKRRFTEVGVIGGAQPVWIGATASPPVPAASNGALIVSFYTRATRYEGFAARLRDSLDRQGVTYDLIGLDVPGTWEMVCAFKAEFIREQWRRTDRPVIWLDADATLEGPPGLLAAAGADFAITKHGGWKFAAGSILFGRGAAAEALLDRWVLRCQADPLMWDQNHLDAAWADVSAAMPLVTRWLPPGYFAIFDNHDAAKLGPAVVLQHQASRGEVRTGRKREAPPAQPEALRVARRASRWLRGEASQFGPCVADRRPVSHALAARLRALAETSLPLLDVGFGSAPIADAFAPGDYIGADMRPDCVLAARRARPEHAWRLLMEEYPFPACGTVLLLDVLAHLPDASVWAMLGRAAAAAPRLIICDRPDGRAAAPAAAAGWQPVLRETTECGRAIEVFTR